MGDAMKSKRNRDKPAIDLENIFLRLMMIGQRRLRALNKSALVKRLGVIECTPATADIVIVDVQQLLYRIVWPHGSSPSDVIESIRCRLSGSPTRLRKSLSSISTKMFRQRITKECGGPLKFQSTMNCQYRVPCRNETLS